METDRVNRHRRWRKPAAIFGCITVLLTGCGHSGKPKANTTLGCSWPAGIVLGKDAILVDEAGYSSGTKFNSEYQLVSMTTGGLLADCGESPSTLALPAMPNTSTDGISCFGMPWQGGARPGGPDGTVVATRPRIPATSSTSASWSEETVVLDMATGVKAKTNIAGFEPAQVARDQVIMVNTKAKKTAGQLCPPLQPADWCLIPLAQVMASPTPAGSNEPMVCRSIPGAKGQGTPLVLRDGTMTWLPTTDNHIQIPAKTTPPTYGDGDYWVRTGHGMITQARHKPANKDSSADVVTVTSNGVSPNGVGFLLNGSGYLGGGHFINELNPQPFIWFTLGKDPTKLVKHHPPTGAADIQPLIDQPVDDIGLTDSAISDDGKTLYTFWNRPGLSDMWLIAIPDQGKPRLIFHYTDPTDPRNTVFPRFITVPNPDAGQDK